MNYEKIVRIVKQYRGYGNSGNSQLLFMDAAHFVDVKEPFTEFADGAGGKERLGCAINALRAKYPDITVYVSIYDVEENEKFTFVSADEIFLTGTLEADVITEAFECEEEYIQPSEIYDAGRNISALVIDENGEVSEFRNVNNERITALWWD